MRISVLMVGCIMFYYVSIAQAAEQLELTTYYPSPNGVYSSLTMYGDIQMRANTGTPNDPPDLVFRQNDNTEKARMRAESGAGVGLYFSSDGDLVDEMTLYGNGDLTILGDLNANGTTYTSDIRFKENIVSIGNPLEQISRLRGVFFTWKVDAEHEFPPGVQIGMIAQDVEKEFPQLVSDMADGYKGIDYGKFTAVLLEAVKAQQKEIELLKEEINVLKRTISK